MAVERPVKTVTASRMILQAMRSDLSRLRRVMDRHPSRTSTRAGDVVGPERFG